tara:strand:+ start:47846 stop:48439 length:594 start_codon:yes stop_codon:yes gene_type:complete
LNKLPLNEIFRKVLHLFSSVIPIGYYFFPKEKIAILFILLILIIIATILELFRVKVSWIKIFFSKNLQFMMRPQERDGLTTGATWLLIGSFITISFFPIEYAIPALLFLTIGDTFAAIIGLIFPLIQIGHKTLSGSISGFTISLIFVIFMMKDVAPNILVLGCFSAMIAECAPIPINDNLTIPIVSGFMMFIGAQII